MHAERCPVCCGSGKYNDEVCHGCNGKGWVEVNDYIWYPWYPWYPLITPSDGNDDRYTITWTDKVQ